eukprot:Transcript_1475.p1 GENE.Transcript_1475~~Transcript_1475.p1  ORF type:complete len:839 (-),score=381.91 Transcript_1475:161-2677(-)
MCGCCRGCHTSPRSTSRSPSSSLRAPLLRSGPTPADGPHRPSRRRRPRRQWCLVVMERGGPDLCDDPKYPSYALPILPRRLNLLAELGCLLPLLLDVCLRAVAQGGPRWAGSPRQVCTALLATAALADIIWGYATPIWWWRAAPYLRAGLLMSYSIAVQQQVFLIQRAIPSFSAAAALLLLFILFAAYVATLVFPPGSAEGDAILTDFTEAGWQLLILLTTANYPDVMMPAYTQCRAAALFFAAFVMLGVFFLMNYLLAVIYGSYTAQVKLLKDDAAHNEQQSLDQAFEHLDWERQGFLSRERLGEMLDHLPRATAVGGARLRPPPLGAAPPPRGTSRRVSTAAASELSGAMQRALLFATLDASGDAEIQREEFSHLCLILQLRYRRHDTRSLLQMASPAAGFSRVGTGMRAVVGSTHFDHALDFMLVLSAISLAVDPTVNGQDTDGDGKADTISGLSPAQAFFSALFLGEVLLKALLLPWNKYARSSLNRFDAAISVAAVAVSIAVYLPNGFDNGAAVRAVLSLRLVRLLRLLRKVQAFHAIVGTFFRLLPAATTLLKTLTLLMFIFASIGLHLFGGCITTDTSGIVVSKREAKDLAESDFGQAGYYPNSFNDLPSGMLTLFELSVVNNWFVIADGYVAVRGKLARWFFIAYYLLGVVVALNIVVAFVLDAYTTIEDSAREEQAQHGGLKVGDDDHLVLDAARVTGTDTGLSGEVEVSLDPSVSVSLTESRRKMLAALFTPRADEGGDATPGGTKRPPPPGVARGASWRKLLTQLTFRRPAAAGGEDEDEEDEGSSSKAARRVSFSHAARGLATGQAEAGPSTEPGDKEATPYQKYG